MTTIPVGALVRDRELPELGPGRIVAELKGGASRIVFEHEDEIRDVELKRVDVVRLPLIPGTNVQVRSGRFGDEDTEPGEVIDAELPDSADELCDYVVEVDGEERTVSEAELFPEAPESTAPLDQFDSLFWRGPFRFFARWGMHRTVSRLYEDSEGLPSLIGARIDPGPRQLRAVRQVLWSEDPNYIVADASRRDRLVAGGLVVQAMTEEEPDNRVLVVAPGSRTSEWKTQLELRFGGREYARLTEASVASLEFHQLAQVFQQQRMIVSTGLIAHNRDARTMLVGEEWDLVVLAGAHRLDPEGEVVSFARELAEFSKKTVALSPMPRDPDAEELNTLFSMVRPGDYAVDDASELEAYIEEREEVWELCRRSLELLGDDPDDAEVADIGDDWTDVEGLDPVFEEYVEAVREGDAEALDDLLAYVQTFHGFADVAVRTPRSALESMGVDWPERSLERLEYEADSEEREVVEQLAELPVPEEPGPSQSLLRALYHRRCWETPERFSELLHERAEVLEGGSGASGEGPDLMGRLAMGPDPVEGDSIWDRVVEQAPPLPDEREWIGGALGSVQDWENAVGREPARFGAAGDWIEEQLDFEIDHGAEEPEPEVDEEDEGEGEEPPEPQDVIVVSSSRRSGEAFHGYLVARLGEEAVELYHGELPDAVLDDAMGRFQEDPDCRVLVVDDLTGQGRSLEHASAVVHLDAPWSPDALEARIDRLDRSARDRDVVSVVPVGPDEVERRLVELYDDVLQIFEEAPGAEAWDYPSVQRDLFEAIGRSGAEGVEELCETWRDRVEAAAEDEVVAFQGAIDPRPSQLEGVVEFAELLDFVDGIDDPLPVRHWARMIGIDDHRVRPGVYDFKWHWSSVRRDLAGFDQPEGEDPEEWADEETVRYLSGTFSRQHALDDESLEFFGPGHQLVDALVDDAMSPTDGRATVFARRLDGQHRGKVFAVIVARCDLDEECWGDLEPSDGLIRRAHRRFWPESVTAMVELDLRGDRDPKIVEDSDLVRRLEESYEGPEADQKIEYEQFVRAIQDASAFRDALREAVELGLDDLREERDWLVEDAADRLEEDFALEFDHWRGVRDEADDEAAVEEAERQIELRERIVESVRDYSMEIDALALVVGGTPESLLS